MKNLCITLALAVLLSNCNKEANLVPAAASTPMDYLAAPVNYNPSATCEYQLIRSAHANDESFSYSASFFIQLDLLGASDAFIFTDSMLTASPGLAGFAIFEYGEGYQLFNCPSGTVFVPEFPMDPPTVLQQFYYHSGSIAVQRAISSQTFDSLGVANATWYTYTITPVGLKHQNAAGQIYNTPATPLLMYGCEGAMCPLVQ